MLKIRAYRTEDKTCVMNLLEANTPAFFHPSEKEDLENYLENEVEEYFVAEENGEVVGAGGINYFPEERTARLSWDVVKPHYRGRGIGRKLTAYRIDRLRTSEDVDVIIVRTTQLAYKFYEKMGFELSSVEKGYWAEGFDLYQMVII